MARMAPPCAPKKAIAPSASTAGAPVTAGGRAGIGFRAERGARASLPRHGAVCCGEREEVSFGAKGRRRVGRVSTQRPGDSIAPVGPCSVDPGARAARRTRCARGRTGREVEEAPEVFRRRRSEHDGAAVGRVEAVRGKGGGGGGCSLPLLCDREKGAGGDTHKCGASTGVPSGAAHDSTRSRVTRRTALSASRRSTRCRGDLARWGFSTASSGGWGRPVADRPVGAVLPDGFDAPRWRREIRVPQGAGGRARAGEVRA